VAAHELGGVTGSVRELVARPVPSDLTTVLRITASRERLLRSRRVSLRATFDYWGDRARLWMYNLMRPVALPVAGGLLSAVFIFSMLAPMYINQPRHVVADVPTTLARPAALKNTIYSVGLIATDIVVDVWVDGTGRLVSYEIPPGQRVAMSSGLRRSIENALICTEYEPATMFGQPKSGKLRIILRHNPVEVKG
jgi:hypothetical protein